MAPVKTIGWLVVLGLGAVTGCAAGLGDDSGDGEQDLSTQYVMIQDFGGIDQFAWFDLAHRMNAEFADVCGDTGCAGGERTNFRALTFSCAVSSVRGSVRDCVWTFATAATAVDANTAAIVAGSMPRPAAASAAVARFATLKCE